MGKRKEEQDADDGVPASGQRPGIVAWSVTLRNIREQRLRGVV